MKITLFIPTVGAGGAERVITLMANYWAERGHTVILLSLDRSDRQPFFPIHPQVTYIALNLLKEKKSYLAKSKHTISQILSVRKCIVRRQPDVLIAQLDIAIFLATSATLGLPVKVIVYEGTNPYLSKTNRYLKKLNNVLYRSADHLVLQTQQIARTFPAYLQAKISVIYNPIVQSEAPLDTNDYSNNLLRKRVVSVGRLVYPKAYEILIKAFHTFSQEKPDWLLLIMGEGELRPELDALCKELNITDRVSFPGSAKNPINVSKSCSIFVLSSRYEGLPNTLCEAMSVGMPVIATRCKFGPEEDRKSTRLNSSHSQQSRMPSSA